MSAVCVWWLVGGASALAAPVFTPVAGSPFVTGVGPWAVAFSPTGGLLATANQATTGAVSVLTVNPSTGALTPVAGSPFATDIGPESVAFSPTGGLLATADGNGLVSMFTVTPSTGALTSAAGSPFFTGSQPFSVAFSPTGGLLATVNGGGFVSVFAVNALTGSLTQVAGSSTGGHSFSVVFSPTGGLLATANFNSDTVSVFAVNASTGVLTPVTGSPFMTGNDTDSVAFSPTGGLLAAANYGDSTVSVFAVNASTGALTPVTGSPFATGSSPVQGVFSPTGGQVAFSPTGGLLATANDSANTVTVFAVNPLTGALTQVAGSPFKTGNDPDAVAFSPTGGLLATTNLRDGTVSVFSLAVPSPTITSPASGERYALGQRVTPAFSCDEGPYGPAIASCITTVANGRPVDTSTPGRHTFTVTAEATDGQYATSTVTYTVLKPSNQIVVSHIKTQTDGTISFEAKVPGPGKLDVLETASVTSHLFASGRTHASTTHAGVIRLRVSFNARGKQLVHRHRSAIVLRLLVTYSPTYGTKHTVGFYGLHPPR